MSAHAASEHLESTSKDTSELNEERHATTSSLHPTTADDDESTEEVWEDALEEVNASNPAAPIKPIDLRELLHQSMELKDEGNAHFREAVWHDALQAYMSGLSRLPPRPESKEKEKEKEPPVEEKPGDTGPSEVDSMNQLEHECALLRAVLNANIAACHVKMGNHKQAVDACTEALHDDPKYAKALHRRAQANDTISTWTSLTAAEKDYSALLEILPNSSPLLPSIRIALQKLKPRLEKAQKEETEEMMGKLKDLGNSVLGRFGLSTDNFQFVPNGQGGYSMNFVK
jgi:tetratricopeptide (TPR) repeat protein